jgi:hypothetical protein
VRPPSTRWPVSHGKPLILRPTHEAVIEDRPLFKDQVLDASEVDRVLIPASNNCKLGSHWSKGPWIGAPIYTLTLAERSTCPKTCPVREACMGNHMHWPVRLIVNDALYEKLESEIKLLSALYEMFTVRLHQLGDLADETYTRFWLNKVHAIPELATFGFTAHLKSSKIGALIEESSYLWDRFRIRFSAETDERSTTVMIAPPIGRHRAGITCPVDAAPPKRDGKPRDLKCGSCGLCLTSREPIVFKLH